MSMTVDELKQKLEVNDLEEQRKLLCSFISETTDKNILEGIRISNEALEDQPSKYVVTSQIRE